MKVKYQDNVTGKCRGSAYQEYNQNFNPSKKTFVVFHNLQNSYSYLIFQKIGKYWQKLFGKYW